MQSLCLNVEVLSQDGTAIEMKDAEDDVFRAAEELGIDLSRGEPSSVEEVDIWTPAVSRDHRARQPPATKTKSKQRNQLCWT